MSARQLLGNRTGASAAEFALVLPLLLLLTLGLIDAGRFMWEYNRAEKATQMGVRYAVVTDLVAGGLANYTFSLAPDYIPQGQPIPTANFSYVQCNNTSCGTCSGSMCGSITYDSNAFTGILNRMQAMYPLIGPSNVQVEYRNVGLGYAGDPNGPDVAPLVTVRLQGLTFKPITCMLGCSVNMPVSQAALTLEDGSNNGVSPARAN